MRRGRGERGMVMTVAILAVTMIALLAAYVLTVAYNHRRLAQSVGGVRMRAAMYAQAGVVDAQWRLRTDPGGTFAAGGTAYDPPAYSLDVNGDGTNDVSVDISAVTDGPDGNTRRIVATGTQ
ncbi:MAG TPA: hypothetical protein VL404_01020 [Candidatus Eisenbacteria bacterium]|jgi:Tfp pilus assembly protein PilX|nr:hypothetical protein [Candidatus Eisenbacteria bacterium]